MTSVNADNASVAKQAMTPAQTAAATLAAVDTRGVPDTGKNPGKSWSINRIASPDQEPINREVIDNPARSLGHLIQRRAATTPDRAAYKYRDAKEAWRTLSWKEFYTRVEELAAGLLAVGLTKGSAAGIIAGTSMDWVDVDVSFMAIGVQSIAIYPTSIKEDISYILNDSQCRIAIVEDASQVDKLVATRDELSELGRVYVIDPTFNIADYAKTAAKGDESVEDSIADWLAPVAELRQLGRDYLASQPEVAREAIAAVDHDTIACLQYTSGTTGKPKGAVITHGAWSKNVASVSSIAAVYEDDVHFIWLPMAHLFGRFLVYLSADAGVVTAIDGRIEKIVENLQEIQPTVMGGAPRIFEKAYSAIMAQFDGGGLKAILGKRSMALALADTEKRLQGSKSSAWHRFKLGIADRVVLRKIRAALGGRVRMFISGSAPINQDITKWFTAMGMPIAEGYGLTEGCITHLTRVDAFRVGTIGWPLPGVEADIASDGELRIRSEWNLERYHNRPEATEEVLPGDGYMYTGDIARVEDGFYYITDRKKALMKTSNGKYVAPAAVESEFKGLCPIAMELVTYGEGQKFIVGMVVLEEKATRQWCETNGVEADSFAAMTRHPKVIEFVQECMAKLNSRLNSWEQVKRFRILDRELTIEKDELTASLKLRRKHVHTTMESQFKDLYRDPLAKGCYDSSGVTWVSFEQPALKEHPVLDDAHDIHIRPRRH